MYGLPRFVSCRCEQKKAPIRFTIGAATVDPQTPEYDPSILKVSELGSLFLDRLATCWTQLVLLCRFALLMTRASRFPASSRFQLVVSFPLGFQHCALLIGIVTGVLQIAGHPLLLRIATCHGNSEAPVGRSWAILCLLLGVHCAQMCIRFGWFSLASVLGFTGSGFIAAAFPRLQESAESCMRAPGGRISICAFCSRMKRESLGAVLCIDRSLGASLDWRRCSLPACSLLCVCHWLRGLCHLGCRVCIFSSSRWLCLRKQAGFCTRACGARATTFWRSGFVTSLVLCAHLIVARPCMMSMDCSTVTRFTGALSLPAVAH